MLINFSFFFNSFSCCFSNADVSPAGKVLCAMCANRIPDAFMAHAKNHGNVAVTKVGVAYFAIRTLTIAQIIGHAKMVAPVSTPATVRTHANVRPATRAANAKSK